MKKNILAISMLTTAGLFAENTNDQPPHEQSEYCNTCCCTPCCCVPCCVPQPKKCIDCECYTPQFYDLQCDWGVFIDAEFLYWYARETNTAYGVTVIGVDDNTNDQSAPQVPGTIYVQKPKRLNTSWDPGFRVGIGMNSSCDGWDYYLNWTYFKNCKKGSTNGNFSNFAEMTSFGQTEILNPWATSEAFNLINGFDGDNFMLHNSSARWRLTFNQIDLEIGRKYWLSPCFTLRPFAAIRGAWTKTKFNISSSKGPVMVSDTDSDIQTVSRSSRFNNRLWGVGFLTGIEPNWFFCSNFILYSQLDVALLWGEQKMSKNESVFASLLSGSDLTILKNQSNRSTDSFFQMSTILDLGIGLRWEETWCCDRYRTRLDLGWEHHIWLDHTNRFKTVASDDDMNEAENVVFDDVIQSYFDEVSNLGYGGFVLRVRFEF